VLETRIPDRQTTTLLTHYRSTHTIIGTLTHLVLQHLQRTQDLEACPLALPVTLPPALRHAHYLAHASGLLLRREQQIRTPDAIGAHQHDLAWLLPPSTYDTARRRLREHGLLRVQDLVALLDFDGTATLMSFAQFASLQRPTVDRRLQRLDETPLWYRRLITHLSGGAPGVGETPLTNPHGSRTLHPSFTPHLGPLLPHDEPDTTLVWPRLEDAPPEVEAWTDGSLHPASGRMGAAVVLVPHLPGPLAPRPIATLTSHPPLGGPSSTKAELWAILLALRALPDTTRLTNCTDSQAAITAVITACLAPMGVLW
jgi:hypothetical protein